jgi:hypothetical protein
LNQAIDPSAAGTDAGFRYAFGTDSSTLAQATYTNSGGSPTQSFTFSAAGSYTIYARVIDKDGGFNQYSTTVLVNPAPSTVSTVVAGWGAAGTASLVTASDGLRLLPVGRTNDIPWLGLKQFAITFNQPTALTPSDVVVNGISGANYGPVTVSGGGTTYVLTLAQGIIVADRVTMTITDPSIAPYTRRLDVLPGDVNDDGVVNAQDLVLIRNQILGSGSAAIATFGDINGDGVVDMTDFNLARQRIGTMLP